jgi:hypothetical protein
MSEILTAHYGTRSVNKGMTHKPTAIELIEGAATALSSQWSESWIAALRSLGKKIAEQDAALEFIGDHLEGELGLLSADDYDIEYGTNETVIIAFNKVMEVQGATRRIRLWVE